jgi:xylan 1,4-beta-xylosidase
MVSLSVLAIPRSASATDYQLTVNAANEIGQVNRFWQGAVGSDHMYLVIGSSRPGENLQGAYALAATELGMKRVRGHGIFDDDVGVYHEVNGQPTYTWTNLDQILDYITSIGMDPLVEVSFMPSDLASGTQTFGWYGGSPGNITLPKDWSRWSDFMYNVAAHAIQRYGVDRVRTWNWEIWNEPDLPGGTFFTGTEQDYFQLYDTTVQGLLRADPQLRVGGPSVAISSDSWIADLIDHCMTNSVKLDFISWHVYPQYKADPTAIPGAQRHVQGVIDQKKAQYPQLNVDNYLTEWNTTYLGGTSFDNEMAASFVAKTVHGLFADQNGVAAPNTAAFWVISELWEEWQTTADAFDTMGMVTRTHNVRKPSYLAFQMMAQMYNTQIDFQGGTTNSRGLNGWATVSDDRKQVEVLIYDHNFVSATDSSADFVNTVVDNVTLQVTGLPFSKPSVTVRRYGVDHDNNNAYTVFTQAGSPSTPSDATWAQMEQAGALNPVQPDQTLPTSAGALTLTFQQDQPGVSLLLITEEGAVVGPPGSGADAGAGDAAGEASVDASAALDASSDATAPMSGLDAAASTDAGVDATAGGDSGTAGVDAMAGVDSGSAAASSGGTPAGYDAGATSPTSGDAPPANGLPGATSGCACRVGPRVGPGPSSWWAIVVAGIALARRRRRVRYR